MFILLGSYSINILNTFIVVNYVLNYIFIMQSFITANILKEEKQDIKTNQAYDTEYRHGKRSRPERSIFVG